jgi:hypothetical protein
VSIFDSALALQISSAKSGRRISQDMFLLGLHKDFGELGKRLSDGLCGAATALQLMMQAIDFEVGNATLIAPLLLAH